MTAAEVTWITSVMERSSAVTFCETLAAPDGATQCAAVSKALGAMAIAEQFGVPFTDKRATPDQSTAELFCGILCGRIPMESGEPGVLTAEAAR